MMSNFDNTHQLMANKDLESLKESLRRTPPAIANDLKMINEICKRHLGTPITIMDDESITHIQPAYNHHI